MLGIIDMNLSNIQSVLEAFKRLGASPEVITGPEGVGRCDALILPGVGAFGDGIQNLKEKGLIDAIKRHTLDKHKSILGICLGMQIMAKESEEYGRHKGLGLIEGKVISLKPTIKGYRLPNMGWCDLKIKKRDTLFSSVADGESFYFAHSYYLDCADESDIAASIEYSGKFVTAAIERGNIFGVQFHPEKSQDSGLDVLESFLRYTQKERFN